MSAERVSRHGLKKGKVRSEAVGKGGKWGNMLVRRERMKGVGWWHLAMECPRRVRPARCGSADS